MRPLRDAKVIRDATISAMDSRQHAQASSSAEAAASTPSTSAETGTPAAPGTGRPAGDSPSGTASTALEDVRVECLMNARYHAAREAFLDSVHRWLMFGVIVLGAGAVIDLLPSVGVGGVIRGLAGAAVVVLAAIDLTFDLSNRARTHALMKRRYFELLAEVTAGKCTPSEVAASIHRYSADEEAAYQALLRLSWNAAQEMVHGDDHDEYVIPRRDMRMKNFRRFEGKKYHCNKRSVSSTEATAERQAGEAEDA